MWFKHQNNNQKQENNGILTTELRGRLSKYQADLECEEAIIIDKERFGRVSTIKMRYLREKYGYGVANRALARIQKRYKPRI
jgi:hypothetical protein